MLSIASTRILCGASRFLYHEIKLARYFPAQINVKYLTNRPRVSDNRHTLRQEVGTGEFLSPEDKERTHALFFSYVDRPIAELGTCEPAGNVLGTGAKVGKTAAECTQDRCLILRVGQYALNTSPTNRERFLKAGFAAYYRDVLAMLKSNIEPMPSRQLCNLYYNIAKLIKSSHSSGLSRMIGLKTLLEFPIILLLDKKRVFDYASFEILVHALQLILEKVPEAEKVEADDDLTVLNDRALKVCAFLLGQQSTDRALRLNCLPLLQRLCCKLKAPVPEKLRPLFADVALEVFDASIQNSPRKTVYFSLLHFYDLATTLGIDPERRLTNKDSVAEKSISWIDKWLSSWVTIARRLASERRPMDMVFCHAFIDFCVKYDRKQVFLSSQEHWMRLMAPNVGIINDELLELILDCVERIADHLETTDAQDAFKQKMKTFLAIKR